MIRPFTASQRQPPSDNEEVAKLRLRFSHISLRELERRGVVDWDRDKNVVKKGTHFEEMWEKVPQ